MKIEEVFTQQEHQVANIAELKGIQHFKF